MNVTTGAHTKEPLKRRGKIIEKKRRKHLYSLIVFEKRELKNILRNEKEVKEISPYFVEFCVFNF